MKDIKFQLMVSKDEVREIDEFRWKRRIDSRAEAMRQLIAKGLEAEAKQQTEDA